MKTKQTLLTIAFLTFTIFLSAQGKFDYMTIFFHGGSSEVSISINGITFQKEEVKGADPSKSGYNTNGILLKIKEYEDKNWELVNLQLAYPAGTFENYFAYLRKKKNEK